MKLFTSAVIWTAVLILVFFSPCLANDVRQVGHYPLNSLDGVIDGASVTLDRAISTDDGGSIRIRTDTPTTVRLFETGDIDVENARLFYTAKIRTENVTGKVYLEMWCNFTGKGEFFSRALHEPISGTNDWVSQQTPFFLQAGQNPDNVKLNLVIDGSGTVWIDDIRLVTGPLQ